MKAVILAGGQGTRMGPTDCPKPMIEVGGRPLLWHLMQLCSAQGVISEFILALGYKGAVIKDYFLKYPAVANDVSIDLGSGESHIHSQQSPGWRVHLINTGLTTNTGGRLKRLAPWLRDERHFLMTYGDGLANVDLRALEQHHISHGRLATVTAVRVPERFGRLVLNGDSVTKFQEKPNSWINGGFFILSPKVLDYIDDDETIWEREPLERLCAEGQLTAFRHEGFWNGMDTPADLAYLQSVWHDGRAPWMLDSGVELLPAGLGSAS
jgi:glucose-1-phosphate cytidylyltransferase